MYIFNVIIINMWKLTIFIFGIVLYSTLYLSNVDTLYSNFTKYQKWKKDFGFKFNQEEDVYRKMIFNSNLEKINKHNSDSTQTYKMGVNQFTHLTQEEFVKSYLKPRPQKLSLHIEEEINPINADVDWTTAGVISPVKDQGNCKAGWAFTTTAMLESKCLMRKIQIYFSEQQLIDCSRAQGNLGCQGGSFSQALAYIKQYGITTQAEYTYVGIDQTCKFNGGSYKISNLQSTSGCNGINNALQMTPVVIFADATNWSKYQSGIFSNCKSNLNGDFLLVGVTSSYWKIKNSWGTSWGENGYIRLAYGNTCGICNADAIWPV